jgi:tRNA(Ile)-lysidine synthase
MLNDLIRPVFDESRPFFVEPMSDWFENKLMNWIAFQGLADGVGRLLLAVSGGCDSVAMAHAMTMLTRAGRLGCVLVIGHVNHNLRGDQSDADADFVRDVAADLGLSVQMDSVEVTGYAQKTRQSIETAARVLRLHALAEQCRAADCDAIATAHHMDDQAETILHRLMRGTGYRGLCGIRPSSSLQGVRFIRPMLNVSRGEIERYCGQCRIRWRNDATNRSTEPTRNRIRHVLMPALRADFPTVTESLNALSQVCRTMQGRIEGHASELLKQAVATRGPNGLSLHRHMLADCTPAVFYEVLRETLIEMNIGLRDYTQRHFDMLRHLAVNPPARRQFPNGLRVRSKSKTIIFEKEPSSF